MLRRSTALAILLAVAIVPYFLDLGGSSIWDANEAFYVETPREMMEHRDYVTPTFNYEPRLNKPVLSYWIVAGFYHVFGISVAVQRVPIALAALILILTAKAEESDQVIGFAVNADDYVTKPFSVKVLTERVRSLLRRRELASMPRDVVSHCGVTVDRVRHLVTTGDGILDLTPTEFALLDALMREPGRAYRRGDLIDSAMGEDTIVLDRTIDVHVRHLREKIERDPSNPELILTMRGAGYRFRPE